MTALLPAILASFGAAAAVLGTIEGLADGLSSAAKLFGGWWVDRLARRKPLGVGGYTIMAGGAALIAAATSWPAVLAGRTLSWIARGLRTPARKALLAEAVTPETYGRAFGFERTMDTVGAIGAPLIATALLAAGWSLHRVLWLAVAPAAGAALVFATCVRETPGHVPRPQPFWPMLRKLPDDFRRLLGAVGVFGAGNFAASFLTLYAIRSFAPGLGATKAVALAVGFYAWRNVVAAAVSYPVGWLADRINKRTLLAIGYGTGAIMAALLAFGAAGFFPVAAIFTLSGFCVGTQEVMEDALSAGILAKETRGTGFGLLAAVNGAGDLVSSLVVGWLWAAAGPGVAFGFAGGLMAIGTLMMIAGSRRL